MKGTTGMDRKPNIVLVMGDQHRYDCVGFANAYPVKTPNIDALAEKGVWFEQAYSTIPTCCPARQSLISGKRPERFGAHWNYDITLKIPALPTDEFSYARALKDAGYNTAYVGKWHVNGEHDPTEYGFDKNYGEYDYFRWVRTMYPDWNPWSGEFPKALLGGPSGLAEEQAAPHFLAERAIEMMNEMAGQEKPFHLVLSISEPHLPCRPSGRFAEMYSKADVVKWGGFDDDFVNKPYIQRQQPVSWGIDDMTWDDWSECVARYYGSISEVDAALGLVVSEIERLGIAEDTVIIYTSDHGDMCGSHHMIDKHYVMYDDVVHVPFVMRWDGHFRPRSCPDFVHNFLDLHATMLEIAGAKPCDVTDGLSLCSQLGGTDAGRDHAISTYNGQQFGLYNQRMIRNKRYKYIWNLTDVDEFYDLEADPYELHNAIYDPEYKDIIAEMRKQLYADLEKCEDRIIKNGTHNQLLLGRKL